MLDDISPIASPPRFTVQELKAHKHAYHLRKGHHAWAHSKGGITPPALGDHRWTGELILASWYQAEHGHPPDNGWEYRRGDSGGGFDVLSFKFKEEDEWTPRSRTIDTTLPLNRRNDTDPAW